MRPHHRAHGVGIGSVTDHAQRLGGAPLHQRVHIAERHLERRTRGGITNQAKRERGHLPHVGLCVGQQLRQRVHGLGQADTAKCKRGAAADAGFAVVQQPDQIRGRRRSDDRGLRARGGNNDDRRLRVGIADDALILQPDDPRQLVFVGDNRRLGGWRRHRRAGTRAHGKAQGTSHKAQGTTLSCS